MIFLERGRELIAAQVVEKEMLLLLLIDIILVVWGCSVNMYIVPKKYVLGFPYFPYFLVYLKSRKIRKIWKI